MDKKSISFLIVGILFGALSASIGFAFGAGMLHRQPLSDKAKTKTRVLTLAHTLPQSHPVHAGILHLQERLKELSDGQLDLRIYPDSQLGGETKCIELVQQGGLDMTKTSAAPMEAFVSEMSVFGLPYVFRDRQHFWSVLDGEVGRYLLESGQSSHLLGICYFDAGSRSFYTKDRPVLVPSDLKGMKIRVMNSETQKATMQILGAAPTPISWPELYSALQQGVVDGAENNPPSILKASHHEVIKHLSLDEHTMIPDILVISTKTWSSLPQQYRSWLSEAAKDASHFQRTLWEQKSKEALKQIEASGVKIHYPDKKTFIKCVQPFLQGIEDQRVSKLLVRIHEVD